MAVAAAVVIAAALGACEATDELHITGHQAGQVEFEAACAPASVQSVAEDGTLGLSYHVFCSDGRIEKVDDRLPGPTPSRAP